MPPKSTTQQKGQQTLSSFFAKKQPQTQTQTQSQSQSQSQPQPATAAHTAASKQNGRAIVPVSDLEDDGQGSIEDAAPPLKRARHNGDQHRGSDKVVDKAALRRERVDQWRFVETAAATNEHDGRGGGDAGLPSSSPQRSQDEERRHQAFRTKLLGRKMRREDAVEASADSKMEAEMDIDGEERDEESHSEEQAETPDPPANGRLSEYANATNASARRSSSTVSSGIKGKSRDISAGNIKYTPLELQVLELKAKHPDVLLLFEVGYKYIAYDEDAVVASKELNIACFPKNNLRVASVPTHRIHFHARRLVNAGYKVGIVRQTETRALKAASSNASTPFTRELTELYTASTWVEGLETTSSDDGMGDRAVAQNSLVAIVERFEGSSYGPDERVSIGLIAVQAATGVVVYDQFTDSSMRSELETRMAHLQPAELLLPPPNKLSRPTEKLLRYLAGSSGASTSHASSSRLRIERTSGTMAYDEAFSLVSTFYENADEDLLPTSSQSSASGRKVADDSRVGHCLATVMKMPHLSIIALATCLKHLEKFALTSIFKVTSSFISFHNRAEMLLSTGTLYNLELFSTTEGTHKGSLLWLIDKCKTVFGKRLLRRWVSRPLTDKSRLEERSEAVSEMLHHKGGLLAKVPELLLQQPDLEKGLARMLYGQASPNELATVLLALNRITHQFDFENAEAVNLQSTLLSECLAALPRPRDVVKKALSEINLTAARKGEKENMFVEDKYPSLQEEKDKIAVVQSELDEYLDHLRKELKRPSLQYATVSGIDCLVEVRTVDAKKVPADWLRMSATKSMVRFHTPKIIHLLKRRDRHKELLAAEASKAYLCFLDEICQESTNLRNAVAALGTLDALTSLAQVAALPGYTKPVFVEEQGTISISGLRHPMSESVHDHYVPNDIEVGSDAKGVILTGANMGGKSSTVRAIALCVILAQIGSFVPASDCRLSIHDAVLTRMGASDELAKGRSTFMVEAEEAAEIMRTSTCRSLVILDELGRGTSTFDGQAIASAILTHLMTREPHRRPTTFFITHYPSICSLADRLPGVKNMHMAFVEREVVDETEIDGESHSSSNGTTTTMKRRRRSQVVFLYKLKSGPASSSFGIHCASLAGLPTELLTVATQRAGELERHTRQRLQLKRLRAAKEVLQVLQRVEGVGAGSEQEAVREEMLRGLQRASLKLGVSDGDVGGGK